LEPQTIIAVLALGLVGVMLLISKVLTRLWVYILLLSPSWAITLFNVFDGATKGETIETILANHASSFLFILYPIDQYVIADPSLCLYGVVLSLIWLYVLLTTCVHLLGGWGLPIAPLIWWLLGKGMPNTMALIGGTLPSWLGWLTALSGLPLILMICIILGFITVFIKRRKR
jgi:hypothetical protein